MKVSQYEKDSWFFSSTGLLTYQAWAADVTLIDDGEVQGAHFLHFSNSMRRMVVIVVLDGVAESDIGRTALLTGLTLDLFSGPSSGAGSTIREISVAANLLGH